MVRQYARRQPATASQEKAILSQIRREAAIERLRIYYRHGERTGVTGRGARTVYVYRPGLLDTTDPKVLRGEPILPRQRVVILEEHVDPLRKFVWVIDVHGNEQSVYRRSLKPVEGT